MTQRLRPPGKARLSSPLVPSSAKTITVVPHPLPGEFLSVWESWDVWGIVLVS